jgi:beta-galactosidase
VEGQAPEDRVVDEMTGARSSSARQTLRLDEGWLFHRGDVEAPLPNENHVAVYMANKAGYARGAAKPAFDDSDWRIVDLPHDWSVEGPIDRSNYLDNGFLPRGIGWYRRHFRLDDADRGKYLALQFDGVATHCTVWVNGHLLHRNFCGYTPFTLDISDVARFGDELNCVAVRVDATPIEGWWYEGAGVYRHVWLIKANAVVHVTTDGISVAPRLDGEGGWLAEVKLSLENAVDVTTDCFLDFAIVDPDGQVVTESHTSQQLGPRSSRLAYDLVPVADPKLWSLERPHLYELRAVMRLGDVVLDKVNVRFGFRTIRFDPDAGFFLNDQPLKLKGTCNHQDHAGVGVAVPDSIHEFRIRRLKEMGCNAYRCAHHPPATELLDACDRIGMLVIDENRNFGSSPEHLAQLRSMVLRDRNHPSVILWSICNEEAIQGTPVAASIARAMQHEVKRLDPSRPVTAAVSGGILNDDSIADVIDVMGINYQLPLHDQYHEKHPKTPLLAAETHCALSTRGAYTTDAGRHEFASNGDEVAPWGATARETWRFVSERPYVAGLFAWTGFDYRGEPTPHAWPCVNSHFGILDTCGFPKDSFFLHKAWWTSDPFVQLLPHWNWAGRESEAIRVAAYTNCDEVELRLNGESLGRHRVDPIDMAEWRVPYRPGELRAIGFREGRAVAETSVATTGATVTIDLEADPTLGVDPLRLPADGEFALPVTVFALDEHGRRVPTADDYVRFEVTGPARIIGVGNGDPTSHEPGRATSRSLFNGLAQVILQTTKTPGKVVVSATARDRRPGTLTFRSIAAPVRPSVLPARRRHILSDWRMSAVTPRRPDPNRLTMEQDVNSWERVDPARGPQAAWSTAGGYAIYRTGLTLPKAMQPTGGRVVFTQIAGAAEAFVDGACVATKSERVPAALIVPVKSDTARRTLTLLIHSDAGTAGIIGPVELVPAENVSA